MVVINWQDSLVLLPYDLPLSVHPGLGNGDISGIDEAAILNG